MEIYLENYDGKIICFNHAVKAVMEKNEGFSIKGFDDSNCDSSGAWWLGGCIECEKEREEREE